MDLSEEKQIRISQSSIRTIISRSYYSGYLQAREYLVIVNDGKKLNGYLRSGEYAPHKQVTDLLNSMRGPARIVSQKLKQLKYIREDADYELNKSYTLSDAQLAITLCDDLMESLGKLET